MKKLGLLMIGIAIVIILFFILRTMNLSKQNKANQLNITNETSTLKQNSPKNENPSETTQMILEKENDKSDSTSNKTVSNEDASELDKELDKLDKQLEDFNLEEFDISDLE